MTNLGPSFVYTLFFLVGAAVVALPVVVATALLRAFDRYRPVRFAAGVVGVGLLAYAVAVLAGFDPETGLIPLGLGVLYAGPALVVATAVVRLAEAAPWDDAAAWGTYGWLPALAVAVASWTVVPLNSVVDGTPAIGPLTVVAFAGYCGVVGLLGGLFGVAALRTLPGLRRKL